MLANLAEGKSKTFIFLARNGHILSHFDTDTAVLKVILERFLFTLSYEKTVVYRLMSLEIASFPGLSASAVS